MSLSTRGIALRIATVVAVAVTTLAINACSDADGQVNDSGGGGQGNGSAPAGAVFAMTNATADNRIVAYGRAADGTLTRLADSVSTQGQGIGVDLDVQGPLRLSADHRFLYAVNAGSDDVTVFSVNGAKLSFLQRVPAGDEPVALTVSGNLLYVLNGSVAGNGITGFTIAGDGKLTGIPDSFRALASPIAVPGDIEFSPDGSTILVTEKVQNTLLTPSNIIDAFKVDANGIASAAPVLNTSVGIRPFSLAFSGNDKAVVVESFNAFDSKTAASSYDVRASDGQMTPISSSVPNNQTDGCWIVITPDQRYVYTANFASGTISNYSLDGSGTIALINGAAASFGATSQPVDLAMTADGQFLYQLLRGTGGVAALVVNDDGSLTALGDGPVVGALPVADGASGLAAY